MKQFIVAAYFVVQADDAEAADHQAAICAERHNLTSYRACAALYLDEGIATAEWEGDAPHTLLDLPGVALRVPEALAPVDAVCSFDKE